MALLALLVLAMFSSNDVVGQAPGYYYLTLPPGCSMLGSVLATSNNTVESFFAEFPVVFGHDADGVTICRIESSGFRADNYLHGWSDPKVVLAPGEGWFCKNPRQQALVVRIEGEAVDGTNRLPAGFSVCSSIVPQVGTLTTVLDFPAQDGDAVFVFNPTDGSYSASSFTSNSWSPSEPIIGIGQSFWVRKAGAIDWVRSVIGGDKLVLHDQLVAQVGQLNFFTYSTDATLGRVFDVDGVTLLSSNYVGQLYVGTKKNEELSFTPVGTPENFQPEGGAGYIRSGVVSIPFASGGQTVGVQLRVWRQSDGATFEAALSNRGPVGKSIPMAVMCHAAIEAGNPGLAPEDVNKFPSFHVATQAPIITGIAVTGAGAQLGCAGTPGEVYWVQAAANLRVAIWQNISTNLGGTNGVFHFDDADSTNYPMRYYRVAKPQP
jgi:hypothetical protein